MSKRSRIKLLPWVLSITLISGCGGNGGQDGISSQTGTLILNIQPGTDTPASLKKAVGERIADAVTFLVDVFPPGGTTAQDLVPEQVVTLQQLQSNPTIEITGLPLGAAVLQVVSENSQGQIVGKTDVPVAVTATPTPVVAVLQPLGTATITATDPNATLLIAADTFGNDGVIASPDSNGNFSLSVPIPTTYQFYVATQGGLFPIYDPTQTTQNLYQVTQGGTSASMGSFTLQNGQAIASNSIVQSGNIALAGEQQKAPGFFSTPDEGGLSSSQLNALGLQALQGAAPLVARGLFQTTVNLPAGAAPQNDVDTANFFLAFSRVAAVAQESQTTGSTPPATGSGTFNTIGALLDASGAGTRGRGSVLAVTGSLPLPNTVPQGEDVRAFVRNRLSETELTGALANLAAISPSFTFSFTPPGSTTAFVSDQANVLALQAAFQDARASLRMGTSWNFGGSLTQLNSSTTLQTVQAVLAANSQLGTPAVSLPSGTPPNPNLLPAAQQDLIAASNSVLAAIHFIQARPASSTNFVLTLANVPASTLSTVETDLGEVATALTKPSTLSSSVTAPTFSTSGFTFPSTEPLTLNVPALFSNQALSLQSLAPTFNGNVPGLFPSTIDQLVSGFTPGQPGDPNLDLNADGIPDILEGNPVPTNIAITAFPDGSVFATSNAIGTIQSGVPFTVTAQVVDQSGNPFGPCNQTNTPLQVQLVFDPQGGATLTGGSTPTSVSNDSYTFTLTVNGTSGDNLIVEVLAGATASSFNSSFVSTFLETLTGPLGSGTFVENLFTGPAAEIQATIQ